MSGWFPLGTSGQLWQTIKIGGGGFVTGLDITPDGTKVCRSDTYPAAYLWSVSANKWLPLITANSMPAGFISPRSDKETGCWEIRICPSLTTKLYMMYANAMFVSTNSGGTWTQLTNFPTITNANANDGQRVYGWKIAVDPQNDAIVYAGTPTGGLQVSSDSGVSWATVSGVGTAGSVGYAIAFDPTSSVSGGKKQGIFVATYGVGVYRSINGGTSFTQLNTTGMPTTWRRVVCDQNGKLWVCTENTGQALWTWTPSAWVQNAFNNSGGVGAVAIDPNNASNVVATSPGGRTYLSNDGGATYNPPTNIIGTVVTTTGDATWQTWNTGTPGGSYNTNPSALVFDPSSVLYQAWGFGVWASSNPIGNLATITWQAQSRGISGLDCNYIIHPPGGNPIGVAWDLPIWNITDFNAYPAAYGPDADYGGPQPVNGVAPGWTADWAAASPSTIIAAIAPGGACYSTNKGVNWTAFPSQTPFAGVSAGGSVAASTPTNFVAMGNGSAEHVYFTTNQGTTWSQSSYGGNPLNVFQNPTQLVCADRVTANKFYIYSPSSSGANPVGIYVSTDSGATFTKVAGANINIAAEEFQISLQSVPGKAGHLFLSGGFADTGIPPDTNVLFHFSIDGGANWTTLSNIVEVTGFGFGTVVAGQSYPTIYIAGWSSNVYGVYKCINFNSSTGTGTWTLMGENYPEGWFSRINVIAGDPSIDGACSVAFNNGGFKRFG